MVREGDITAISVGHKVEDLKNADYKERIEIFKCRIEGWYLEPTEELRKHNDYGFMVTVALCILVDTLSQFYYGIKESKNTQFRRFLRDNIKGFDKKLPHSIQTKRGKLKDFADVFYAGFRCGILHDTKISYGEIDTSDKKMLVWDDGRKRLILNQNVLLDELKKFFYQYISDLKEGKRKNKFQRKFKYFLMNI